MIRKLFSAIQLVCRSCGHTWFPFWWRENRKCILCGCQESLHVGRESITLSPPAVGDVVRWSASQAPLAAGDIGMDATTGRIQMFVGSSRNVAHTAELDGSSSVRLVKTTGQTVYPTIAAAILASASGDTIVVGVGTWAESFTLPAGVELVGFNREATIISGAAATGTRITLSNGSSVSSITVTGPSDATSCILGPSGGSEFATVRDVNLIGGGASSLGVTCRAGGVFCQSVSGLTGAFDAVFNVTGGRMSCVACGVLGGTVANGLRVVNGAIAGETIAVQEASVVVDGIEAGANGLVQFTTATMLNCTNALHVTSATADVEISVFKAQSATYDILVDPGVTTGKIHILAMEADVENKVSGDGRFWANGNIFINYQNDASGFLGQFVWGKLRVGQPEKGRSSALGYGPSYVRGMRVFTTDSTAGAASDGGNFIDVTSAAKGEGGSTFGFQGTAANHTILFGSTLTDGAGALLRHWGYKYKITSAATTNGAYIFEIWNGAAWQSLDYMVSADSSCFPFGNTVFIRANTEEYVSLLLQASTTWATKTINGVTAYWSRVRISSPPTTGPTLDQWKLAPSHYDVNEYGITTYHGLSRFKQTIFSGGNVFGESGTVVDVSVNVGSGGVPTGWSHNLKNSSMNSNGDAVTFQFTLPRGICPAFPVYFRVYYNLSGAKPVTVAPATIFSMLPIQASGVSVADPAGGLTPTGRTEANTETMTAKVALTSTKSLTGLTDNKIHSITYGPFSINNYYEGDVVAIRYELDDDGTPDQDLIIWAIEIIGVMWAHGEPLGVS